MERDFLRDPGINETHVEIVPPFTGGDVAPALEIIGEHRHETTEGQLGWFSVANSEAAAEINRIVRLLDALPTV